MVTTLLDAIPETCGGKAATLGALLREGLPVPEGFVVPIAAHHAAGREPHRRLPAALRREVAGALARMGDPPMAVRSSAANEDSADASAAGQYESILAVQGVEAVADAIRDCWASASSARVANYWNRTGGDGTRAEPAKMAVLVQRLVDADISGVMFTPARPGDHTRIEASWGLGLGVVGGTVTPDTFEIAPNGTVRRTIGRKTTRLDRGEGLTGVIRHDVPEHQQTLSALDDATAVRLAVLGNRVTELLGGSQDIEWAIADGTIWLLQSRPVTAPLPPMPSQASISDDALLSGIPGAHGAATGKARIVSSPSDFGHVEIGDIIICPYTDPAWTPLFTIAAGVVTETGGALSHAAIVAREYGIPAVLGVSGATTRIRDGARITLNGSAGTLTLH
ncbi:PEP/pyruvate-binding domain-containing protein [Saxibacter everestensis]|uniref:PEP/pyruvate-binding domain-containing protein n=1 Tax=Saxibacter everestensis TaxID=2909229 RepID=A0ABY8QWY5_9MICO|nr:PEP/pyruvate-binding domain-containing protein [Brevibacteriaceae bacterium ZFBP1038]